MQLTNNLDRQLGLHTKDFRATQRDWQITFCEIVRQVYVHCSERGMLLDRVRRWYDLELKRLHDNVRDVNERERRRHDPLKDDAEKCSPTAVLLSGEDQLLEITTQQREFVQRLVRKAGARGLGKVLVETTREFGIDTQHEMLSEMLPELLPLPSPMVIAVISAAAAEGSNAHRVLMHRIFESVEPSHRAELLIQAFTSCEGSLDGAESALADVLHTATERHGEMRGMDGMRRATRLMSKLGGVMSETTLGSAVRALLAERDTMHKVAALGDALEDEDSDTPKILKELVEQLVPEQRRETLVPLLTDLACEERPAVISPVLAGLKTEEFQACLAERAKQEKVLLSGMPPQMLTSVVRELPDAVDGARLVADMPEEKLKVWGANMMANAPESTCKVWLTQLLTQLKITSTYTSLSQLLVSVLTPEHFAYAYANHSMDDRLHMLRCIQDLKQLGVVSPAPWSKPEVDLLVELLDLRSGNESAASSANASPFASPEIVERRRRGSVVGAVPETKAPSRGPQKLQLIPLDNLSRSIADVYQKKVKDDATSDSKGKLRCPMVKFVRNYLLRQYGMKSMAEKALRELTATVRAYSHGGSSSLVRIRMFGEMTGMLKDLQGVAKPPWVNRKADFFLFILTRLARCAKEEGSKEGGAPQRSSADEKGRMMAIARARRLPPAAEQKGGGSSGGGSVTAIKEVLCREEVTISIAGVQTVLEAAVPNASVRARLMVRLEGLEQDEDDEAPPGMVHMDDVLEVAMLEWDEQEDMLAPQIDKILLDMFKKEDADGTGRLSFHSFERFCRTGLHANLDEDQVLDMFDEAIRVTEEATGEETDTVLPEGFARIVREYNLLSLKNISAMVDAVAVGRQESGRRQSVRDRYDGTAAGSAGVFERLRSSFSSSLAARRTVISTTSSKIGASSGKRGSLMPTQKADTVHKVIHTAVKTHFLFRHLDAAMHRELVQRMVAFPVVSGQDVIRQGDKGDYFYVAELGVFDVIVGEEKVHTYTADPAQGLHPCFGELALLYAKPRAATIRAASTGMLWGLDRRGFRSVQTLSSNVDLTKLLRRMDIFSSLPFQSFQTLMNHMVEQNFRGGEYVFRQGDTGDTMFIITQGSASVLKSMGHDTFGDDEEEKDEVMQLEEEMYFGERALLDNEPRKASVRAITALKCMAIDRTTFERLLGPLQQIIDVDRQRREREAAAQKMQLEAAGLSGVSASSFKFEAPMISFETGGFVAATHLGSGEAYTLRAESKLKLFETEQAERVSRELEVMRLTGVHGHLQMLPAMLCTFASPVALFSLFKTRIACELSCLIEQMSFKLSRDALRYVSSCVVLALERLHCGMNVVARSLSPDALAVDENGCICVVDFRLAKPLPDGLRTFTLCGVAEYLSPEQVTCSGHSLPVDFWGLGVLLWELAAGEGPWGHDPNEMNIYRRITDHTSGALSDRLQHEREQGFLPSDVLVPTVVDLIDKLLEPEPLSRLGASADEASARAGFETLKSHAWFTSTRWDQLIEGLVPSPLLTSASTHVREQLQAHVHCNDDLMLSEVAGTEEFSGEGSWFAQY